MHGAPMTSEPRGFDYEHEFDRSQPRWIVKLAWLIFFIGLLIVCIP